MKLYRYTVLQYELPYYLLAQHSTKLFCNHILPNYKITLSKAQISGPRGRSRCGHRCVVPLGVSLNCANLMLLNQSGEEEALLLRFRTHMVNGTGQLSHIFLIKIVKQHLVYLKFQHLSSLLPKEPSLFQCQMYAHQPSFMSFILKNK